MSETIPFYVKPVHALTATGSIKEPEAVGQENAGVQKNAVPWKKRLLVVSAFLLGACFFFACGLFYGLYKASLVNHVSVVIKPEKKAIDTKKILRQKEQYIEKRVQKALQKSSLKEVEWILRLGVFMESESAGALQEQLQSQGVSTRVVERTAPDESKSFVVETLPYVSAEEAESAANLIQAQHGIPAMILSLQIKKK